jgi:DNA repair ATPase RecN
MPDGITGALKKIGGFIREEAPKFKEFMGKEIHTIENKLSSAKRFLQEETEKHSRLKNIENSRDLGGQESEDLRRIEKRMDELNSMIRSHEQELEHTMMLHRIPENPQIINEIILQYPSRETEKLREVI